MARFGHAASAVALLVALSSSAEGRQVQTDYGYDALGRLTRVSRPGSTTDYSYDSAGNRTQVTTAHVNNPPPSVSYAINIPSTGAYAFDPRSNHPDPDGDALTVTGASPSASPKGTASYSATQVTYTPFANQGGQTDTLTYTVIDGKGGTGIGTVTINIGAVSAAPVAQNIIANLTPNSSGNVVNASLPLSFSGTPTSVSIAPGSGPGAGSATVSGNSILYSSNGWSGQTTLNYTGTNAFGTGAQATATIKVAPAVSSPTLTATPGVTKTVNLTPYALTTGVTSMTLTGGPSKGNGSINGTTLTYTPNGNATGADTLTYTATSPGGTSTPANITFNIQSCSVPVAGASSATVAYNSSSNVIPLNISGGTPTSVAAVVATTHGYVEPVNATMYYTPHQNYSGSDSFTYNATNACGVSNTATGTITVSPPPNRNPTAGSDNVSIAANAYAYFDPRTNDSDPDGDPLTLVSVSAANHGSTWTNSNNYISYVPTTGWSGTDGFYYTISDGRGGTAQGVVNVFVSPPPVNHAPTATSHTTDPVYAGITTWIYPLANDTDPDGDALTVQSIDSFYFAYGHIDGVDLNGSQAPADFGSVTNNGNYVAYRAPHLSAGSYMAVVFYYTVSDGHGGTSQNYEVINVYGPG